MHFPFSLIIFNFADPKSTLAALLSVCNLQIIYFTCQRAVSQQKLHLQYLADALMQSDLHKCLHTSKHYCTLAKDK